MSNLSGWSLTGRLISKHFGALGDKVSEAIANFDPETATEADRDQLKATLLQTAQKLATARANFEKEHSDVVELQNLLATDIKAMETIAARLQAGTVSEATVTKFCDEMEANKAKLPDEIQKEADAKSFMEELQTLVDAFSKQLSDFDAIANKAKEQLARAHAQKDMQEMRMQRQGEIESLKSLGGHSTALNALTSRAQKISNEAAGMKIVADINQKPIDDAAEIDAIRKSVASDAVSETPMQRLMRLSGKTETATA